MARLLVFLRILFFACAMLWGGSERSSGVFVSSIPRTSPRAQFYFPLGVAVDPGGTLYFAERYNRRIRKVTPSGLVSTLAGRGVRGFTDGRGAAPGLFTGRMAVDSGGTVYVADRQNHRIWKVTPDGLFTTLAGSGKPGFSDGSGASAQFDQPNGVAVDASGIVYVADSNNHRIRKVTPSGVVSTLAGGDGGFLYWPFCGSMRWVTPSVFCFGFADGMGAAARFDSPQGVAVDSGGTVYVADSNNHRIRKVSRWGYVTTLAGSGGTGFADGPGATAQFCSLLEHIAVDAGGNVYVVNRNRIRKVTPSGVVSTLAWGGGARFQNAWRVSDGFNSPNGLAVDSGGMLYVADFERIWKVSPSGDVAALAPSGQYVAADGTRATRVFKELSGVAVDSGGTVYVADYGAESIRKVTPSGVVSTLAGGGTWGFADGPRASAKFAFPWGVAVDPSGTVYVADLENQRIRKVTPSGLVSTFAGSGTWGFADGPRASAQFTSASGVAVDASGTVYVADRDNHRIRKVTPSGLVSTLAGSGKPGFSDGSGASAQFDHPNGVAVDASGMVYVADRDNHRIRKVTPSGVVSTLAGSGAFGYADGLGAAARFSAPHGVAVDSGGTVYVADTSNCRIRMITRWGYVTTLAGSGVFGYADGPGATAQFPHPEHVAVDSSGAVYVTCRDVIRVIR
jgi:sugar lactone lactonase YvrE